MQNELNLRNNLYSKMEKEYNNFIQKLKESSPEKIISSAYEKVIKEEILGDFLPEYEHYDIDQVKALSKCNDPLEELYQGWMDCDGGIHTVLEDSIDETLSSLVEEQKAKKQVKER